MQLILVSNCNRLSSKTEKQDKMEAASYTKSHFVFSHVFFFASSSHYFSSFLIALIFRFTPTNTLLCLWTFFCFLLLVFFSYGLRFYDL